MFGEETITRKCVITLRGRPSENLIREANN